MPLFMDVHNLDSGVSMDEPPGPTGPTSPIRARTG